MSEVAFFTMTANITDIVQGGTGRLRKLGKAGIRSPPKPPKNAEQDNPEHHVANPLVNATESVTRYPGQQHTQHTTDLVPLIYLGPKQRTLNPSGGILADIAPTLLGMMEMQQPDEMTGNSLLNERA